MTVIPVKGLPFERVLWRMESALCTSFSTHSVDRSSRKPADGPERRADAVRESKYNPEREAGTRNVDVRVSSRENARQGMGDKAYPTVL
jgi:hypothetical protein